MGCLSFSFPFRLFGIWGNGGSGVVLFCANVFFVVIAIDFLIFVPQFFDFIRISCVENSPVCLCCNFWNLFAYPVLRIVLYVCLYCLSSAFLLRVWG